MNSFRMSQVLRRSVLTAAFGLALAGAGSPVQAQEFLPRAEALKIAVVATLQAPARVDGPVQVDADLKRALAGRDGEYGLLILPETKLSAAVIEAAGKDPVPVAQLWLRRLTPMMEDAPVEESRLQMVTVQHDGESVRAPLCVLAARRTDAGALELVVFGKGREPIARAPIQKVNRTQAQPIELDVERESEAGRLTFFLGGKFEAVLKVTELPE